MEAPAPSSFVLPPEEALFLVNSPLMSEASLPDDHHPPYHASSSSSSALTGGPASGPVTSTLGPRTSGSMDTLSDHHSHRSNSGSSTASHHHPASTHHNSHSNGPVSRTNSGSTTSFRYVFFSKGKKKKKVHHRLPRGAGAGEGGREETNCTKGGPLSSARPGASSLFGFSPQCLVRVCANVCV